MASFSLELQVGTKQLRAAATGVANPLDARLKPLPQHLAELCRLLDGELRPRVRVLPPNGVLERTRRRRGEAFLFSVLRRRGGVAQPGQPVGET